MLDAKIEEVEPKRVTRYVLSHGSKTLTFSDVLERWQVDPTFRAFFSELLAHSPFSAFRWETPSLHELSLSKPFEFVLLDAPRYANRKSDRATYREYFRDDHAAHGVVSFASLGGDATLVVPSPQAEDSAYGHLAAFVRHAPASQVDALWRVVANVAKPKIGRKPVWLNTAGGGVAWLHVRIDAAPKYYGYAPYTKS